MKNKHESLIILSRGFPANEADTTCMPSQQIFVKALKEICPGLNIIVLAFQYPFSASEYQWHGVKVIAINGNNKGKFSRVTTWTKTWKILRKLHKEHQLMALFSFW